MTQLTIAGATLNQTPLDWENNLRNIRQVLAAARARGVEVLCLPELSITAYGCEDLFLGEWLPQKALEALWSLLPDCEGLLVTLGLPLRFEGKVYNCACVVADGQILGFTAKQFMALDGVHYEPRWFTPWQPGREAVIHLKGQDYPLGDLVYDWKEVRIGIEICEDAWHGEERPAIRHCQERGAQLILGLNASHFAFGKHLQRLQLVRDIAQRFRVAYIYTNLLGNEAGRMIYDGDIIIAQGDYWQQNDKGRLSFEQWRLQTNKLNFGTPLPPASRPPAAYTVEQKYEDFTKTLSLALFDYLRKSRSRGFALSLSGGADSAACAVLVAEMLRRGVAELGLERFVHKLGVFSEAQQQVLLQQPKEAPALLMRQLLACAYQAADNSSEATLHAARTLAESLNATFYDWNIGQEVNTYTQKIETALQRQLTWEQDDIALQNIQARARSPIIWMLTNVHNYLLMATSNRSEGSVGYATMDGDTSGSISPIAGIDKPFLRAWLQWAESELGYKGLAPVNALVPTAELRPQEQAQTDEVDLMPYPILQAIEYLAIRQYKSPVEVFVELRTQDLVPDTQLKDYITKFFRLWSRNQWKRERLAPSFHLDEYNLDPRSWYRFPILSGAFKEELEALARYV
ncbi:NAD(+) synthase [Eisenibacter elegans]|uniref:NAD(+) synthase n=1 Tax=Eisenibacter elegans TaxID=997 RepID=UPI0004060032|nr:NAD(+) synthase [Eisenibacter elegans]